LFEAAADFLRAICLHLTVAVRCTPEIFHWFADIAATGVGLIAVVRTHSEYSRPGGGSAGFNGAQ
jgi:hypothetical protein